MRQPQQITVDRALLLYALHLAEPHGLLSDVKLQQLCFLSDLQMFGKAGFQALLGHLVEMTQLLREHLDGHVNTTVLNRDNFGTVTLFRVYPDGVDTVASQQQEFEDAAYADLLRKHNEYNRRVFTYVRDEGLAGRGVVISLTDCYRRTTYGEPIVALKSFILSPFVDEENVAVLVQKVLEAREKVGNV